MNHSSAASISQHPTSNGDSWKSALWLVSCSALAILALQLWSAAGVIKSSTELRKVLSEAHSAANQLEQRIGYGGLIHDFKNYILRPEEESYRESALLNASQALTLLERLHRSAVNIGIDAKLTNTREMLKSYSQRLDQVRRLSASGLSSRAVDKQVRFDDAPALQETGILLEQLDTMIQVRLDELQQQSMITSLLSTVGTASLALILIMVITSRQKKHAESLGRYASRISASNDDLSRANTSLNQFAGIVSHDLKKPIRYINMFNKLIDEDKGDDSAIRKHVDHIDHQLQQMDSIIDSLLEFTKFGFAQPASELTNVERLFADTESALKSAVEKHEGKIEFQIDMEESVLVDRLMITRAFTNLIDNSLKYARTEEPAMILVRAETDGKQNLFSVTDNGIGIDARFAENIFEPMARLHGENSIYKGVGIGLSLVRTIIESHGGKIWLDTEYTHGTRMIFTLPLTHSSELREAA